jgi:superfamily II DNA or RNA helicase
MIINIKNKIALTDIPRSIKTEVMSRLSFENPAYQDAKKMGRWTGKIPRYLQFFEETAEGLVIPRGFIRELLTLCKARDVRYFLEDNRRSLLPVDFAFQGELRGYQEKAAADILRHDHGVVSMPTGSGKTILALSVIAERRQPCLIVVHSRELQNQWVDRIHSFLGIPIDEIGIIGGGKKIIGDRITVAMVQTLYKCVDEVSPHVGFVICDEVHRCPANQFSSAISAFDSRFLLGLSATIFRRDQLTRLIFWYCGDLVHKISKRDLEKTGDIVGIEVKQRETDFTTKLNPSQEYTSVITELCADTARTQLIVDDVVKESRANDNTLLVLSDRKSHLDDIKALLRTRGMPCDLLTGSVPAKERESIVQKLAAGEVKVLLSSTQLLSEGFDSNRLGTLFMATPIRFSGRVTQVIGRLLRPAEGKEKATIYDYIDSSIGPLRASAEARQRVYDGGH